MTPNLNRALVLEAPARLADGGGGWTQGWSALGTLRAEVTALGAREALAGERPAPRVTHRIVVRAAPVGSPRRPAANQRLRSGARIFAIHGVAELGGGDAYLTIWAEEGAPE